MSNLDDDELDRRLRRVATPVGMRSRLTAIALDDAELDRRLNDVVLPWGLGYRLRRLAAGPRWGGRTLATAAALLIVVGSWHLALIGSIIAVRYQGPALPALHAVALISSPGESHPPLRFEVPAEMDAVPKRIVARPVRITPVGFHVDREPIEVERIAPPPPPTRIDAADSGAWSLGRPRPVRDDHLALPSPTDDLANPQFAAVRVPRGIEARLNAADQKFLLDPRVSPFMSPIIQATSAAPLTFDTASFELARECLKAGKHPTAAEVRVEEFIAAAGLTFRPAKDGAPRLIVAGSSAPWNVSGAPTTNKLLQVSVQAGNVRRVSRPPTYLTVAVDTTSSMSTGSRMAMVRQALKALASRLLPNDRLTLVALGSRETVLIEEAGRDDVEGVLQAIDALEARDSGRLAEGVFGACTIATQRQLPPSVNRRLIVVSDGWSEFDPIGTRMVGRLMKTSAGRELRLDLLDVGPPNVFETLWSELVRTRGGRVERAATSDQIRAFLTEALTGQSQLVARDVSLSVTFDPLAVSGYRLCGHEPTAEAALLPGRREVDLTAGQTGTVLYELQLKPSKQREIGEALLRWRDPTDGTPHESRVLLTRTMLAPPFDRAAATLQMTTLAASAADWLRGSSQADNLSSEKLLEWVHRLPHTSAIRDVDAWRELLEQMDRLPTHKSDARGTK